MRHVIALTLLSTAAACEGTVDTQGSAGTSGSSSSGGMDGGAVYCNFYEGLVDGGDVQMHTYHCAPGWVCGNYDFHSWECCDPGVKTCVKPWPIARMPERSKAARS